ncbi:alanine racemase [Fulvivirga ligni]|uniref:alanine racemase n=1 Tax=Fulvivirga ligni TaxID=2904246 RepID=UPI001F1F5CD1|nr:alanine racemase [Fulvivirga ligni]UII19704.1 alanine racemase [Fulvivirga ligni]
METEIALYPTLTPIIHSWVENFLKDSDQIHDLFKKYGSPINILSPEPFLENFQAYKEVLESHGLDHLVCFARKANKGTTFVKAARDHGFGVDTASYRELEQCLDLGVNPKKIVLTASIKNINLLELAVSNDVLIIVDNQDELDQIEQVALELGQTAKIGIRIGGFEVNGHKLYTRFGFDIDNVLNIMLERVYPSEQLNFKGFHFHLNGYSIDQRAKALTQTIALIDKLGKYNINTTFIDIGGGLLINYLENEDEWNLFKNELKLAVQGARDPITFQNDGLGYQMIDDELCGELKTYPYFNKKNKAAFLNDILSYPTHRGTIGSLLKDRNISLRLEPGRSLLDQCGITISKVVFRKYDSQNNLLIGLDMNKTQLYSSSADFLLDPIVINQHSTEYNEPTSGYFVGAYCLEQDVILKRKINLEKVPEIGDIVCFVNTAGYMMHFYETEAHLFQLATNLSLLNTGELKED